MGFQGLTKVIFNRGKKGTLFSKIPPKGPKQRLGSKPWFLGGPGREKPYLGLLRINWLGLFHLGKGQFTTLFLADMVEGKTFKVLGGIYLFKERQANKPFWLWGVWVTLSRRISLNFYPR